MTDNELRELLALSAVGALSEEEQMDVDAALRDRPELRDELDRLRDIATTMAEAVSEEPPPALRSRVLETIASTPQLPPEVDQPAAAPPEPPVAPVVPISAGRRRGRWVAVGAVAAAVVALVAGVLVVSPFDSGTDEVADVLDADDAVTIPMPGELAGLTIVHSASNDAAVIVAPDVPVPEGDRVYELWAIRDGVPEPFETFRPDDDGQLEVFLDELDPASAEVWAVTEEPAGGSVAPTPPILNATA